MKLVKKSSVSRNTLKHFFITFPPFTPRDASHSNRNFAVSHANFWKFTWLILRIHSTVWCRGYCMLTSHSWIKCSLLEWLQSIIKFWRSGQLHQSCVDSINFRKNISSPLIFLIVKLHFVQKCAETQTLYQSIEGVQKITFFNFQRVVQEIAELLFESSACAKPREVLGYCFRDIALKLKLLQVSLWCHS